MARRANSAGPTFPRSLFARTQKSPVRLALSVAASLIAVAALAAAGYASSGWHDGHDGHDGHGGGWHHHTTDNTTTTTPGTTTTAPGTTTTAPTTTTVTPPPVTTTSVTTTTTTPTTTTSPTTTTAPTTTTTPGGPSSYPLHTGIFATTFWVGEIFNASAADGSQVCSTYDSNWAQDWSSGVNLGSSGSGTDCAGAPYGGCDGVPSGTGGSFKCATESRTAKNGYFPTSASVRPAENPFYLDLPYDDVNNSAAFAARCTTVPWASQYPASSCKNQNFSYMKNHWVKIIGANGSVCYGQIEDAGPFKYNDTGYVFGSTDARPQSKQANNAGLDVSPALNGCLGFKELDGDTDKVSWQFVDASQVPAGPWTRVVTTRGVS
jgi:hypothetical protein